MPVFNSISLITHFHVKCCLQQILLASLLFNKTYQLHLEFIFSSIVQLLPRIFCNKLCSSSCLGLVTPTAGHWKIITALSLERAGQKVSAQIDFIPELTARHQTTFYLHLKSTGVRNRYSVQHIMEYLLFANLLKKRFVFSCTDSSFDVKIHTYTQYSL